MKVKEVMTSHVVTVDADVRAEEVARLLTRHRISGLPVVDRSGALIGLVSEYDLLARKGGTVAEIMSGNVISVGPETDIEEVARLIANRRIRRVPVLEGGRLVGIVSRSDLIQQIAMRWVCETCGEELHGAESPEQCPRCGDVSGFIHDTAPPRD